MPLRSDPTGAAGGPVRVFTLDDHAMFRAALHQLLEDAGGFEVVGQSASASEALDRIPVLAPDVALVDVLLPDGSGLDVCRALVEAWPASRIVVITSFGDEDIARAAAAAGAWAFVTKQIDGEHLIRTVRRVAAGERLLYPMS
jgi:two-component system, NarL family, response regulator DevR